MDRTVARLNIEYLLKRLAYEPEGDRRQTILRLITEEEAKLVRLDISQKKDVA